MPVYKFKFQKVLEYRKSIENQKKNILGIQIKKYLDEKKALNELQNNLHISNDALDEQVSNGVTISKLRSIAEEQEFFREGIRKKTYSLVKAEEDVKNSRYELMKAMQSKKIMERLNEIYFSAFQCDEKRKFEKQIEEIVSFNESEK